MGGISIIFIHWLIVDGSLDRICGASDESAVLVVLYVEILFVFSLRLGEYPVVEMSN